MQPAGRFDLGSYLQRIGHHGRCEATTAVLAELALRHPQAITFENLDAFTGRHPSLEPDKVHRKLVYGGRGGWCFEQNLLLGEALRAIGFEVADLAGRVLWNRPPDALVPRTHRLLCVRAQGHDWLVDAGFGGHALTGVLDLHSEAGQQTPHGLFRLQPLADGELRLESVVAGQWVPVCRFDLQPQLPVDFEAANFQLSHDPASRFTQLPVVSRVEAAARRVLNGHVVSLYRNDGSIERRELGSVGEILSALAGEFGLAVDGLPELPARIGQYLRTLEATAV